VAAELGDLKSTIMLLNRDGVKLSTIDNLGRTALHIAVEKGHYKIFMLLLEAGADVTAVDSVQRTVLHEASTQGNISMVKVLLQIPEVDVNAKDTYGASALCIAAKSEIRQLILACDGVDVNAIWGPHQKGALHYAVKDADYPTVRALIQHAELDLNQIDELGWTPLYYATDNGDVAMVELLLTRADIDINESVPPPLFVAARDGHVQIFDRLIRMEGVDLDKGWCYESPLDASTDNNHCYIVTVLIEQLIKQNPGLSASWFFDRALTRARQRRHTYLVRVLLDLQSSRKSARSHLQAQ
jgi:ankyrin repeat protein